ncbi:hypothetical protein JAAARDRAFT_58039 [Jaapia argillacea MUCL 33604]|uniref:FAD-binding domain-containing protein n=1 Tax=Jaapia argillacea MUCL 33604 TaxID=933084 RepID=A0A067Q1R7_9AGAM|nr:hypothetical protein JAAARDRAFT_58039 [Jaapia argillacea MUCL 33604]
MASSSKPSCYGRKAVLPLDFLISGGGPAGLCCAIALANAGHRVQVFERAASIGEQQTSGVVLAPNAFKILTQWDDSGASMVDVGVIAKSSPIYRWETGEMIGVHGWDELVMEESGGKHFYSNHNEAWGWLHKIATEAGAKVRLGATIVSVNPETPSVTLASGETITGDILIGADGKTSIVRKTFLGGQDDRRSMGTVVYSGNIPASSIAEDPVLTEFMSKSDSDMVVWAGPGHTALVYPTVSFAVPSSEEATHIEKSPGRLCGMHVYVPDSDGVPPGEDEWRSSVDPSEVLSLCAGGDPIISRFINLMTSVSRVKWCDYTAPQDWAHPSFKAMCIGEAVHPMPVCGMFSASMVVEDAAVLGNLFSRLQCRGQIPRMLQAFQSIREDRCEMVRQADTLTLQSSMLVNGPDQEARDELYRQWSKKLSGQPGDYDDLTMQQWETYSPIFAYDANEATDEWFVRWGRPIAEAIGTHRSSAVAGVVVHESIISVG